MTGTSRIRPDHPAPDETPAPRSSMGAHEIAIATEFVHVVHSWIADIAGSPAASPSTPEE